MTQKKLTALGIATLPARHRPYPDHVVAGLGLRIGTNRSTWLLRYRAGGRKLSPVLGYHPAMSLAAAREAARKLIERVEAGAPIPPAATHPRAALTIGGLIDNYEKLRISRKACASKHCRGQWHHYAATSALGLRRRRHSLPRPICAPLGTAPTSAAA